MPCFTEPEQYEAQQRIDNANEGKHLACRLLTHIFFEEDQQELIKKIKEEAHKKIWWYKRHLCEDIEYCDKEINYIVTNFEKLRCGREVYLPRDISKEDWIKAREIEKKEWEDRKHEKEKLLKKIVELIVKREKK